MNAAEINRRASYYATLGDAAWNVIADAAWHQGWSEADSDAVAFRVYEIQNPEN